MYTFNSADPGGRAASGVGLQKFACWNCGFESRREHGWVSRVSVLRQVEVSASDRSLMERSSAEGGVSECDLETPMT
jgi:hypothetical protein